MSLADLVAPSIETLTNYYASNKLLLIHPGSRFRTLLVSVLINKPPCPLYYYNLGIEDVSLAQFLANLARDLSEQSATFGTHIRYALANSPDDLAQLATALAKDLDELNKSEYLLVLDEYDRSDEIADIQMFIEHLVAYLPAQCHVLINSRTLPRLPWVALVARRQAVVLRDSRMLPTGFYSEHFSENPNVEVYALGPGYVLLNGQHVTTWEGHLPRLLFFFALDRPMCTRADICQAFWPDLTVAQAVNVFHVTKRRLHKALGVDIVLHEGGHYQVNPTLNLHYDVLEFVSSLVEARARVGEEAEAHWQHAIDIYHGNYLQGHDDPWVVSRREDFREGYLEALSELAKIRENQNRMDVALGLYLKALSESDNREDMHRDVIRLYGQLGRRSEAAEHFRKLENDLKERYKITPAPETVSAYNTAVSDS